MHTKCQSQFVPLHRVRGDASAPLLQRLERCCGQWQRQMDSSGGSGGSAGDTAATVQLQQVDGQLVQDLKASRKLWIAHCGLGQHCAVHRVGLGAFQQLTPLPDLPGSSASC